MVDDLQTNFEGMDSAHLRYNVAQGAVGTFKMLVVRLSSPSSVSTKYPQWRFFISPWQNAGAL